jgi:hypothetical protein
MVALRHWQKGAKCGFAAILKQMVGAVVTVVDILCVLRREKRLT